MSAGTPATLFEKIWSSHVVTEGPGGHAFLYIDRHLLHEGSTHAFHRMARNGSRMRRPDLSFATADHYVLTTPGTPTADAERGRMVESLTRHTGEQGVTFFGVGDDRRGIVHVIGPEQGLTLPGILLVCGDSHTATHGAFGCLAFGVGSTDAEARFDREVALDGTEIAPTVTWGTSPQDALPITERVPDPARAADATRRESMERALAYMGLTAGTPLTDIVVDRVFIGSCTNSRLDDLRAAAQVVKGRRAVVPAWIVHGSGLVKRAAEAEGLDQIFREAGFEWREAGCSMCVGMNGETARAGERVASTSNRNFEGRQGQGARTHLVSPTMAAAAAVTGRLIDVRALRG